MPTFCQMLRNEVEDNKSFYVPFATNADSSHIVQLFEKYINSKSYNFDIADMVINVICNTSNISVTVAKNNNGSLSEILLVPGRPKRNMEAEGHIYIAMSGGNAHFNALIPCSTKTHNMNISFLLETIRALPAKTSSKPNPTKHNKTSSVLTDCEYNCCDRYVCVICYDMFENSKPGEQWVQCKKCTGWAHVSCAPSITKSKTCVHCMK